MPFQESFTALLECDKRFFHDEEPLFQNALFKWHCILEYFALSQNVNNINRFQNLTALFNELRFSVLTFALKKNQDILDI